MNPDTYVTYQIVNLFSSDKCFFSTSFLMFHITFINEISTTLSIQFWYKSRYTWHMWSNDMFILWNCISIFYKDRECCLHILPNNTLLFINKLIFDIMNTKTSLLNLNESQCYHHLDLSLIKDFHGIVTFSLSYAKTGWILFRNTEEILKEMLARKYSYRLWGSKHMKDWK